MPSSLRSVVSALLIVLGVVCAALAPAAVWGRNQLLDTHRYVRTVTPLASEAAVQDLVASAVSQQIIAHIDVSAIADDVLPAGAAAQLGPPLQVAVDSFISSETTNFIRSQAFQQLWVKANTALHRQLAALLTGNLRPDSAVEVDSQGNMSLDISQVVEQVKQQLVDHGFKAAAQLPTTGATLNVGNVEGLVKARGLVRVLNPVANWLPGIGLVFLLGGVLTARHRRNTLIRSSLAVAATMLTLGVVLLAARASYVDSSPSSVPQATSRLIFDTMVHYLRWGIRGVLLVALAVAVAAWISGRSPSAVATRQSCANAPRRFVAVMRGSAVGRFLATGSVVATVAVVALGGVILLMVDNPSVLLAVGVLAVVVILLVLIRQCRPEAD